jgi:hypothetical protein
MIRILHDLPSVFLLGRVRHGDRARGSHCAHLKALLLGRPLHAA